MTATTYTHLTRYARPANFADFAGFDRREYFVAYAQHRDSDTLTRSNFRVLLRQLGGESDTVRVIRDNHFAVGWVEAIYVHESNTAACETANAILAKLADYPVVNEDDWSELQYSEAAAYWAGMAVSERVYYCQRYGVSVFAARRAELPEDESGELVNALSDGN